MKIITDNAKTIVMIVERIGVPVILCAFLAYIVFVKLERLESSQKHLSRNQYAMMKKMGVARIAQPERP